MNDLIESIKGSGPLGVTGAIFVFAFLALLFMPNAVTVAMTITVGLLFAFLAYREYDGDLTFNFR